MSRFMLLGATVAVSAAVGGCGTNEPAMSGRRDLAPAPAPSACGGNVKNVKIKDIKIVSATQATIKVPAKVKINMNKAGANWTLDTAGYVFAPAGVVIDTPPGPAQSYSNGSNEFGWCFDTSANWDSKYTVYFRATANPSVTWKCDPMIANYGAEPVLTAAGEMLVWCSVAP